MSETSALKYARYFKLTRNYTSVSPQDAIDTFISRPRSPANLQEKDEDVQNLFKKFEKAAEEFTSLANNDPPSDSEDVADYIKTCTSFDVPKLHTIYNDLLPDPYRLRNLKFDLPLLIIGGGDVRRDVGKIRRSKDAGRILRDFLQDKEDEEDGSLQVEQLMPSTFWTELLKWSQRQLQQELENEKMEITRNELKYLQEILRQPLTLEERWQTINDLLPPFVSRSTCDTCSISPDDFDIDDGDEESEVVNSPTQHSTLLHESLCIIKQEPDFLDVLDAAVDQDFFLRSTQVDEEMEKLLKEFTNHDAHQMHDWENFDRNDGCRDDFPPSKKPKLSHRPDDNLITITDGKSELNKLQDTTMADMKLEVLAMPLLNPYRLSDFGMSEALALVKFSETFDENIPHPPFSIPTVHEAICSSMPTMTQTYDKFWVDRKDITTSDKLLFKEPGLRILDLSEMDETNIAADDFEIEELQQQQVVNIKYEETQLTEAASPSRRRDRLATGIEDHQGPAEKSPTTSYEQKAARGIVLKEETPSTSLISVRNPFANQSKVSTSETHREAAPVAVKRETSPVPQCLPSVTSSFNSLKKSNISAKLALSRTELDDEASSFTSLLPIAKSGLLAQNILVREHKLDNSLSNFFDLRGKKFKFPAAKPSPNPTSEISDDPIESTPHSVVDRHSSREDSFSASSNRPVEAIREEVPPPIASLQESRTVVANSTLLQTRKPLIQFLERPDEKELTVIYRDLDTARNRGPDVILNPTTCLIITNLQSLNQRPLPGQKSTTQLSSAHDLVVSLAQDYTEVVLLVHHITTNEPSTQSKNVTSQATFSGFCQDVARSLSTSSTRKIVQPYWLPCIDAASTVNVVNAWTWQVISCHAHQNPNFGAVKSPTQTAAGLTPSMLIQDETLWERFLCKAGLNPLAAQVVLGTLKKSDRRVDAVAGQTKTEPTWGMRRLVAMDSRERLRVFGGTIGIDVVKRLNQVFTDTGQMA